MLHVYNLIHFIHVHLQSMQCMTSPAYQQLWFFTFFTFSLINRSCVMMGDFNSIMIPDKPVVVTGGAMGTGLHNLVGLGTSNCTMEGPSTDTIPL